MGNYQPCNTADTLRDEPEYRLMPRRFSRVTSNLIMASYGGLYYPCIILHPATVIQEGFRVYFLHNQEITETPSQTVLGNLNALMHNEISFIDYVGEIHEGVVKGTNTGNVKGEQPINFLILKNGDYTWVPLPSIFLKSDQVHKLC